MSQRKGLADLFAAMNLLQRPDIQLVVLGTPLLPLKFYRSTYPDFLYETTRSNQDVRTLMLSCDVLVLPSIVEGRAMVQMERELDCHVASFSANDAVYKVQGQPEVIPRFYPEMQEPDFASSRIIAHNRYSTNTYPTFSRVQPSISALASGKLAGLTAMAPAHWRRSR